MGVLTRAIQLPIQRNQLHQKSILPERTLRAAKEKPKTKTHHGGTETRRKPVAPRRRGEEFNFDEKFAQKTRKFGISNTETRRSTIENLVIEISKRNYLIFIGSVFCLPATLKLI